MIDKIYTIDEIKTKIIPIAKSSNIDKVYLFGSYARGQATSSSDLDFAISTGNNYTLFQLVDIEQKINSSFQKDVDLLTLKSIEQEMDLSYRKDFYNNFMKDRVLIYSNSD
jgi:predicted nucleotidyltransferase